MPYVNWTDLDNLKLGKCAEYFVKIEFISHGYDIYTPDVDDHGIDFIARKESKSYNVQVKSICRSNYAYIQKGKILLDRNNIICFLHFENQKFPDIYIIPSTVWKNPNSIFVDRDYSKAEYGINYSEKNLYLLQQYKADKFFIIS